MPVTNQKHPDTEQRQTANNKNANSYSFSFHFFLLRHQVSCNFVLAVLDFSGCAIRNQSSLIQNEQTIPNASCAAYIVRDDDQSRLVLSLLLQQQFVDFGG